ncbi:MAG TPA: protein kinase [Kofleriaceae bacterium]|nr:protein kinase [Kofleriaceae bacterium]
MTGQLVLHYRILAELGQGGMGQVFRARDERLGREVALKMLPAELASDADFQARLLREARAASALNHPGIVTLFDLQSFEGRTFLVMELVEGESLAKLARRGVEWRKAVLLVIGVADALAAAHARGILHRDIKSDNIMITPSGQPKVLDFGLAKLRDLNAPPGADQETGITANMKKAAAVSMNSMGLAATMRPVGGGPPAGPAGLTRAGQLLGTPAYMAPECFEGVADARSEVFALGVVLYELLAGKRPFDRDSEMGTMSAIMLDEPEPLAGDVPPELNAVVRKALAKKPEERFADMASLATALRDLIPDRPSVAALTPPPSTTPPSRDIPAVPRWWYAAGVAGLLVLIAGGWFVVSSTGRSSAKPPKPAAPTVVAPAAPTLEVTASKRITLDPGCEEYPRQHPDGKRVVYDGVFEDDYEIMIVDLETNEHKRLTATKGWDYASALSPDGSQVAFVHEDVEGRTLRVMPIDGSSPPRTLGAIVGYPAWSHDGALLVGDTSGHIVRREPASGAELVVGALPAGARLYHLVDVKDRGIALMWWTSSDADATSLGELDRSGHLRVIEEFATDYEGGLSPASNGHGYYATRKGASVGNQLLYREWGGEKPIGVPGVSPGAGIDVRSDGKRLVFSTCTEREYVVRIAPNAAGDPAIISKGAWQDTNPSIVDAKSIVITSNRVGEAQGWLVELDGKASPRAITPAGALGSAASPDGKLIAYATRSGLGIREIASGVDRSLTTDASDAAPAFTHDGAHIVFERTVDGVTNVYSVATAGGDARKLFAGEAPTASPKDDTIAFVTTADATGTRHIMVGTLAGGATHELPKVEPGTWHRPKFAPDGKRLLVVRGYQQLVAVALDGSTPPRVVWTTTTGSVNTATWLRDGTGIIAAVGGYEGDLWLADGVFP